MNLLITLTSAGINSGPFNLYSDTDGYAEPPFETNVSKQDLLDGYISTLVPNGTTMVRVISDNPLCTNYTDLSIAVPTTTTTTTAAATYCTSWTAANDGNIKMQTIGYIDFTAILAGRTIATGLSTGTIIGYIVAGVGTFTCSIPMTFTTSKAQWNTDALPVVTDKVLTSLVCNVDVVFNNSSEYSIVAGQTNAVVIPGQLTSEYNDCPTTTTTTTAIPTTTSDFCCSWNCNDTIHVPPGGSVTYIDEFGDTVTVDGICLGNPVTITYRSIVDTNGPTDICN